MRHERRHGYLAGPIVIDDGHGRHDLRSRTWVGPAGESYGGVSVVEHDARFILLVEKRNIFEWLVGVRFPTKNACVLATGNGYPGRRFQALLHGLHDHLRAPFYVQADCDPAGYLLFFLIARGAAGRNSRPKDSAAIPDAAYLGLRVGDYDRLGMPESVQIHLNDVDAGLAEQLRSSPWLKSSPGWQGELDQLLHRGFKIEAEAMITLGRSYLVDTYLPERLAANDHLRMSS